MPIHDYPMNQREEREYHWYMEAVIEHSIGLVGEEEAKQIEDTKEVQE